MRASLKAAAAAFRILNMKLPVGKGRAAGSLHNAAVNLLTICLMLQTVQTFFSLTGLWFPFHDRA
jgi:hypothetical protein